MLQMFGIAAVLGRLGTALFSSASYAAKPTVADRTWIACRDCLDRLSFRLRRIGLRQMPSLTLSHELGISTNPPSPIILTR
jgi:hypothetical protein